MVKTRRKAKKKGTLITPPKKDVQMSLIERCAEVREREIEGKGKNGFGISVKPLIRKVHTEERRQLAMELRMAGRSYAEIGRLLGVSDCQAHNDVDKVFQSAKELTHETADKAREIELRRLDKMLDSIWTNIADGVPVIFKGVHRTGIDGKPMYRTDQKAIDRALKIMERRAKLLGIDSPDKLDLGESADSPFGKDRERKLLDTLERLSKS